MAGPPTTALKYARRHLENLKFGKETLGDRDTTLEYLAGGTTALPVWLAGCPFLENHTPCYWSFLRRYYAEPLSILA